MIGEGRLRRLWPALGVALLLTQPGLRGAVVISEFMAANSGFLFDQDGDSADWIELQNLGSEPVDLAGWHLTDSPTNLTRWTFPATNLAAGAYLVVFASGKNRAVAGAELHTDFQLNSQGEYLALVEPDGVTIAQSFSPAYPPQRANVSFGTEQVVSVTSLVDSGAAARFLVPSDDSLGQSWASPAFDDSAWSSGTTGIGYDSAGSGGSTNAAGNVVLSLDFNDDDAGESGAANTESGFDAMNLSGNPGTFHGITVTLSSLGGATLDDRDRATPTDSPPDLTQDQLYDDFIFASGTFDGAGMSIQLTGLLPNQDYLVKIWSYDSSSLGGRVSDWIETGSGTAKIVMTGYTFDGANVPTQDDQDTFRAYVRSSANGVLQLEGRRHGGTSHGVFLNALQLLQLGYGSSIATDTGAAMSNQNASVYIRLPFNVADATAIQSLKLKVKYDDGFVAYLNGQQVASRNAPAIPQWNSSATAEHPNAEALAFEEINLNNAPGLLADGGNVLAIQGLNVTADDRDFLILPELEGINVTGDAQRYFTPPTPGSVNGSGYAGFVADTKFSVDRGFYDVSFTVAITTATTGAEIRWATNGSPPTATTGTIYTGPITITNTAFLCAAAFKTGLIPTDVDTHTYIFLDQVVKQSGTQPGYPATWQGSYPADYGMDPNVVNHPVYSQLISNALRSIPTLSIVSDHNGLWSSSGGIYPNSTSSGPAWERAASIELINGNGNTEFAVRCKLEIHGNASRDNARTPKHSLHVSFSSDYGPSKLRYDWFGGGATAFDKIVFRSCGFVDGWAGRYADSGTYTSSETGETFRGLRYRPENTCYLRDAWVKDSFGDMGWISSRSQYVHLYINGLYWGLYEPSEAVGAPWLEQNLGGPEGAWDVIVGEDNNGPPVVVDGSVNDWQAVLDAANSGITSEAAYQALGELIDIDNLIDYMIVHIVAESEDWPRHNWYVAHRRATNGIPATKFICIVWDQELTLDRLVRRNRVEVGNSGGEVYSPARIYSQLRAWPEFRREFGDRVQKHLFNGGALTPSNNLARLLTSAAIIRDAVIGESARWGDAREFAIGANPGTGKTFTRDEWWQPEIDKLATNFFQKLTADNVSRFRAASLYPSLGAPEFNRFGGGVPAGFELAMTHSNASGTIFFTQDGSDPRVYGSGAVAASAQAYLAPVVLNSPTLIRARVNSGGQWSALVEAAFYPPQDLSMLALTEIMYNPLPLGNTSGDEFEFLELKNTGTNSLNLSGLVFTSGIDFAFPNGTLLGPGEFFILARNASVFLSQHPGVNVNGVFTGKLDNGGEKLTLSHPLGGTVFSVTYDDEAPWPAGPDGYGFSLVPKDGGANQAPDNPARWRVSTNPGGSPGADDPQSTIPPIVINEVLTASTPPEVDQIELFNPTASEVNIGGWFVTDDHRLPMKFRIPEGTTIPAGGFAVFNESQFNPTPGTNNSFSLSSRGESVYLFSGDANTNLTGYSHGFNFGASAPGISFGRYVNSVGEEQFPAQITTSFRAANSGPRVGPVVISEIHYHSASGGDEFVELQNVTTAEVPLYDPAFPTDVWRLNGIAFDFPPQISIPPNGLLLLVATNPAMFRMKYSVPSGVVILGPFSGTLQNEGERLSLQRPDTPDAEGIASITVDEVRYSDRAPWPPAADGGGPSLQRINAAAYGNDPINWQAAEPTPGQSSGINDSDGDGLPDDWEVAHATNPNVPDANLDPDGDGATTLDEFLAGTDPQSSSSVLKLQAESSTPGSVTLQFTAAANHTYSILFKDSLDAPAWLKFRAVPWETAERTITVQDSPPTNRYYRIVTPQWP